MRKCILCIHTNEIVGNQVSLRQKLKEQLAAVIINDSSSATSINLWYKLQKIGSEHERNENP